MSLAMSVLSTSVPTPTAVPDAHTVADIVPFTARALLGLLEDRGVSLERLCLGLGFTHTDLLDRHLLLSHQQVRRPSHATQPWGWPAAHGRRPCPGG